MEIKVVNNLYKINKDDNLIDDFELSLIECCYNEICSFQLAINSKDKINDLNISFSSNNATKLFYEYYHYIKEPSTVFTKSGFYPDCLIPYELFIKNNLIRSVKENENLVFLFQVRITSRLPEDFKIKIRLNNKEYIKSVKLKINNFMLDDSILEKTLFGIFPEMNVCEDMTSYLEKYNRILKEYKISSNKLTNTFNDLDSIIEEIKEKTLDKDISTISLPLKVIDNSVDVSDIKLKLKRLIDESNKDNCNYLQKIIIYNYTLDEPYKERFHLVEKFYNDLLDIKNDLAKYCENYELKKILLEISNITTVFFQEELYKKIDTWCPTFIAYQMKELVYEGDMLRRSGDKMWWYGCVWPMHPYPNYHLDDDLLNIRNLNYMQFYYKIEGNLYWAVNINQKYNLETLKYEQIDIWSNPKLFYPANGDGYLTYDGDKFNTKEVLPSLRLSAIRDGIYDYQYLMKLEKNLENNAKKFGFRYERQKYFKPILEDLFHGVVVNRNYDRFIKVSSLIKELIEITEKGYYVKVNKNYDLVIYSKEKLNLENEINKNKYYKYTINNRKVNKKNIIEINNSINKYALKANDTFEVTIDKTIDLNDYFSLNLEINNYSNVCFILNIYGVNEDDFKYYLGYYLINENSNKAYEEQIDLKFCSKFNDIESTAYCNYYSEIEKNLDLFKKSNLKKILFEVADYSTFANDKPRYSTTYRFEVRKCYLKKEG